ncbi:MAG: SDR family oxidoreductase [Planctomycetaceae bacterium]|nr:SDR family oxidoreductase [Planctomycetaceae bacterium]
MSAETVLVTGASSGIGWELAKLFAADGANLILVARSQDKLEQLAQEVHQQHGVSATVLPRDLSVPGAAQSLIEDISGQGLTVDTLVNNAGFGQMGRFATIDPKRHRDMMQLNMQVLTELSQLFLPGMLERNRGGILNLGSTAAFQPGPNSAVYYATKAYVLSLTEALHYELRNTNVKVTCLCPGPTRTGFGEDSGMESTRVFRWNSMSVEKVARMGHRGFRKGKRLVMPGLINRILAASVRFTPRPIILDVMSYLQPIPSTKE